MSLILPTLWGRRHQMHRGIGYIVTGRCGPVLGEVVWPWGGGGDPPRSHPPHEVTPSGKWSPTSTRIHPLPRNHPTLQEVTHPQKVTPPPQERKTKNQGIRSISGRCAYCWNVFLLIVICRNIFNVIEFFPVCRLEGPGLDSMMSMMMTALFGWTGIRYGMMTKIGMMVNIVILSLAKCKNKTICVT